MLKKNGCHLVWWMLCLCAANLLVMHYYIFVTCHAEETNIFLFISNACSILFDIFFLFLVLYIITRKNIKLSLWLCFGVTLLWSFSNIIYSRFFHHYITISAIAQSKTLLNGWILKCIFSRLCWTDLYLFLSTIVACILMMHHSSRCKPIPHFIRNMSLGLLALLMANLFAYAGYSYIHHPNHFIEYFTHVLKYRINRTPCSPIYFHFLRGEVRSFCVELWLDNHGKLRLTKVQRVEIENTITNQRMVATDTTEVISPKHVIFIIVESLASFSSDLSINNREITPYLNNLKKNPACYYNGKMRENITIGESSDGQLVYMTGLLPLRSMVTVSKVFHSNLPGLPKSLGRTSRMTVPTLSSVWEQDAMCRNYGFDCLFSSSDYGDGSSTLLDDEEIFTMAFQRDTIDNGPFFSVILTMSMHEPYSSWKDSNFTISAPNVEKDIAYYLNACHYTDRQIGLYIEKLKKIGLYENSLIVITADHAPHALAQRGVPTALPLYIIYPQGLPKMWDGLCNQIDVYPTLLDLLGIEQRWLGMGCSLLSKKYDYKISRKKWEISEWMLLSDYFAEDSVWH